MSYLHFRAVKRYSLNREFEGFISPIIVSETLFNFIKANIVKDYGIKPREVVSFLKAKPKIISKINITNIATNDPDFESVNWLKVWKP